MKSTPELPSEDHPALRNELPSYREEQSSIPSTEYSPSVLALAIVTGMVGLAIASILNLNSALGFGIGFLVGFLFFFVRLVLLERQSRIRIGKTLPIVSHEQSITIPCPHCGTVITITITQASSYPKLHKKEEEGGE